MPSSPSRRDPRPEPPNTPDSEAEGLEDRDHYNYQEMMEHLRRVRHSTQDQGLKSKKKRRRRSSQPIHSRRRRRLVSALLFLLIGLPLLTFVGGSYLFSYLHYRTEGFRKEMEKSTGEWLKMNGEFEGNFGVSRFKFQNSGFQGVSADRGSIMAELAMQNIEAYPKFRSLMSDNWHLTQLRCDEGMLRLRAVTPSAVTAAVGPPAGPEILRAGIGIGFHSHPSLLTVERFAVLRMGVFFGSGLESNHHVSEAHVVCTQNEKGYAIDSDRGFLQYARWPRFAIHNLKLNLSPTGRLEFIPTDNALKVADATEEVGSCNLAGWMELAGNDPRMKVQAHLEKVKVEQIMQHNAWGKRFLGLLTGDFALEGKLTMDAPVEMTGEFEIPGLAVKGLDILTSLENYCGVAALQRIEFDKLKGKVRQSGDVITFYDLHGSNPQTLSIVGEITVQGDGALSGQIELGLPNSIWGSSKRSDQKVVQRPDFFELRGNQTWAKVNLSGTLENPQDDLIPRFHELFQGTSREHVRSEKFQRPRRPEDGQHSEYQKMLERMFDSLSR